MACSIYIISIIYAKTSRFVAVAAAVAAAAAVLQLILMPKVFSLTNSTLRRGDEISIYLPRVASSVTVPLIIGKSCDNGASRSWEQWGKGSRSPATKSVVFQYMRRSFSRAQRLFLLARSRVYGINPGRIIRRRGELKLPYVSER